jgi:uncharacterized glyoxalase superfamily protein PhnB
VADVNQAAAYYCEQLGFTVRGRFAPAGEVLWCDLVAPGGASLMFTRLAAGEEASRMTGCLYLYVADVRLLWDRLREPAQVVRPLQLFPYQMVEFAIADPDGYQLVFAQDSSEVPDSQLIPLIKE